MPAIIQGTAQQESTQRAVTAHGSLKTWTNSGKRPSRSPFIKLVILVRLIAVSLKEVAGQFNMFWRQIKAGDLSPVPGEAQEVDPHATAHFKYRFTLHVQTIDKAFQPRRVAFIPVFYYRFPELFRAFLINVRIDSAAGVVRPRF
jgi:hypothetical protein